MADISAPRPNKINNTDLVVQQLSTKANKIWNEIMDLQANRKLLTRYMEKQI